MRSRWSNDSSKLVKLRAGSAAASSKRPAAGGTLGAAITPAKLAALNALSGKQFKLTLGALPTRDATRPELVGRRKTVSTRAIAGLHRAGHSHIGFRRHERTGAAGRGDCRSGGDGIVCAVPHEQDRAPSYSPTDQFTITDFSGADTTAADLGFDAAAVVNVQQYPLGSGAAGAPGDGDRRPGRRHDRQRWHGARRDRPDPGNPALNTGIYVAVFTLRVTANA